MDDIRVAPRADRPGQVRKKLPRAGILESGKTVKKMVDAYAAGASVKTCCDLVGFTIKTFKANRKYDYTWKAMRKARAIEVVKLCQQVSKMGSSKKLSYKEISDWLGRINPESFAANRRGVVDTTKDTPAIGLGTKLADMIDEANKPPKRPRRTVGSIVGDLNDGSPRPNTPAPAAIQTLPSVKDIKAQLQRPTLNP